MIKYRESKSIVSSSIIPSASVFGNRFAHCASEVCGHLQIPEPSRKDQIVDLSAIKTRQGKLHCLARYTPLVDDIFRCSRLRGKLPRLATLDSTVQGYGRRTLSPVWRRNCIYGVIFERMLSLRIATIGRSVCLLRIRHMRPNCYFYFRHVLQNTL